MLGAGSWGIALAIVLAENGHTVHMWEFREEVARRVSSERKNDEFLPGIVIPGQISISADLESVVTEKDLLVFAVPSHVLREVAHKVAAFVPAKPQIILSVAKGIENESLMRMSEVALYELPWLEERYVATLSGPSHAEEVSRRIPTAVVSASPDADTAALVQKMFMNKYFRVYASTDIIGVELGGALKNVIAIAAGICDGAGFGDNTKAALQPRGLVEIVRLGAKLGANPLTFAGLSGMGDLIVTCMSTHSRNRYVGHKIGGGEKLQDILKNMVMVAEGVNTTRSAYALSGREDVDMPITHEVYKILFEDKDPKSAMGDLMSRDAKKEEWG